MEDPSKYLVHATVTADGVVERSDVVGAIFGQTEGLLGDELDLRELRRSGKVGRIDVAVESEGGSSTGELTIASGLDKVETATLAASLETISRVGPCRASLEVQEIEDVRAAKRREVVDRAKELLRTGFDDTVMSSSEILAEVREHVRVADVTEYEGLPAGPRVTDGDAIIVVEGRADVLTMLKYGIKNAIAVEGTNVPDAVAELTERRTVTAFLDGDRGGDLILEELAQVGDVDYVATAPAGRSVEELDHHELFAALRNKTPFEAVSDEERPREAVAATDGSAAPAPPASGEAEPDGSTAGPDGPSAEAEPSRTEPTRGTGRDREGEGTTARQEDAASTGPSADDATDEPPDGPETAPAGDAPSTDEPSAGGEDEPEPDEPETLYDHVSAIVRGDTDRVRFLDADREPIGEAPASEAAETLASLETAPSAIVLDDILSQRLLDRAAERGVSTIVAASLGQFVKRPATVRTYAAHEVAETAPDVD